MVSPPDLPPLDCQVHHTGLDRGVRPGRLDRLGQTGEPVAAGDEDRQGFPHLPIHSHHALAAAALPTHHGDPFERVLVAQAQLEGLVLVTTNPQLAAYDVRLMRVDVPRPAVPEVSASSARVAHSDSEIAISHSPDANCLPES